MSYETNAVSSGIIKNNKKVQKIICAMNKDDKRAIVVIRNAVIGEAASQKVKLSETEIINAVYTVFRHCKSQS